MEQLVARRAHNPKVTGSSPVPATTKPGRNAWLFLFYLICGESSYPSSQDAQRTHFDHVIATLEDIGEGTLFCCLHILLLLIASAT